MAIRKSNKKSNKRFRKTRSKRKRGGDGGEVKLAILLITTHGSLDYIDDEVAHDIDLNVHKINATTPGVCNFVEDEELLDMGNSISKFINLRKQEWKNRNILTSNEKIDLSFKSAPIAQQQLQYFTQSLRSYLPKIDGVYKDMVKTTKSKRKIESVFWDKDDENNKDLSRYRDNISKSYSIHKWKKGDSYIDKTYTLVPEERIEMAANPYNNTILFIGEPGVGDSEIINIPYNLRSNKEKIMNDDDDDDDKNKYMKLSEVLLNLETHGYTDTIIIDLSCSEGVDDRMGRSLRRQTKKIKYGGKRKIIKNKGGTRKLKDHEKEFFDNKRRKAFEQREKNKRSHFVTYEEPEDPIYGTPVYVYTDPYGIKERQDRFKRDIDDAGEEMDRENDDVFFGGKK